MAGLIFYQGPDADPGRKNKLRGNSDAIYEGTLYFPAKELEIRPDPTQTQWAPFTMIVAQSLEIKDGDFFMGTDFAASDVPAFTAFGVLRVALFE